MSLDLELPLELYDGTEVKLVCENIRHLSFMRIDGKNILPHQYGGHGSEDGYLVVYTEKDGTVIESGSDLVFQVVRNKIVHSSNSNILDALSGFRK